MDAQIYLRMRQVEDDHWWFVARRDIVRGKLGQLQLPGDATILDAGCGTGGNLSMLSALGRVVGVEHDPAAVELARARGSATVYPGSLPDALPDFPEDFDVVVMLDVLEHIDDDVASIKALMRKLKPGGYLCITVPAFLFLWGPHDVAHHHKRRYVARRLRAVLESAGLTVRYVSYFNLLLFAPIALVRLLQRIFPPKDVSGELRIPPAPLNRLLRRLFTMEGALLRRGSLPAGVSLLAIAQRSSA